MKNPPGLRRSALKLREILQSQATRGKLLQNDDVLIIHNSQFVIRKNLPLVGKVTYNFYH